MSRQMEQMVTMSIMLMTTAGMLVLLHILRAVLHEAYEWPAITYVSLVVCGVGLATEAIMIIGAHKWKKMVITAYSGLAVARAFCHAFTAIAMMVIEQSYGTVVMCCYMIAFSIALALAAWRATLYARFLRSGKPDVDEHPSAVERRKVPFKERMTRLVPISPRNAPQPPARQYQIPARAPSTTVQPSISSRESKEQRAATTWRGSSRLSSPRSSLAWESLSYHTLTAPTFSSSSCHSSYSDCVKVGHSSSTDVASPPLIVPEPHKWVHSSPKQWSQPLVSRRTPQPNSPTSLSLSRTSSPEKQRIKPTTYEDNKEKNALAPKPAVRMKSNGSMGRKAFGMQRALSSHRGDKKAVFSPNNCKTAAMNHKMQALNKTKMSFYRSDFLPPNKKHLESTKVGNLKSSNTSTDVHEVTKHKSQEKKKKRGKSQPKTTQPHTTETALKLLQNSASMNSLFSDTEVPLIVTKIESVLKCKSTLKSTKFDAIKLDKNNPKYVKSSPSTSTYSGVVSVVSGEGNMNTNYSRLKTSTSEYQKEAAVSRQIPSKKLNPFTSKMQAKSVDKGKTQNSRRNENQSDTSSKASSSLRKEELEEWKRITENFETTKYYKKHTFDFEASNRGNRDEGEVEPQKQESSLEYFEQHLQKRNLQSSAQSNDDSESEEVEEIHDYSPTESPSTGNTSTGNTSIGNTSSDHVDKKSKIEDYLTVTYKDVTLHCVKRKKGNNHKGLSQQSSKTLSEKQSPPKPRVLSQKKGSVRSHSPEIFAIKSESSSSPQTVSTNSTDEVDNNKPQRRRPISDLWKRPVPPTRLILSGDESDSLTTLEATKIRAILGLADRQQKLMRQLKAAAKSKASGADNVPNVKAKKVRTITKSTRRKRR